MSGIFCILLLPSLLYALTLGTITDRPSKYYPRYRALALYLQERMASLGIREEVRVRFAKDIDQMIELVRRGEVDVYIDSLYPTLKVCGVAGCRPLLVRWKDRVRSYRSVIFVRKDSPIRSAEELLGSRIAFDSPYSTSGYFVPKVLLLRRGIRLVKLEDPSWEVPRNSVGYLFAGQEENVVAWVFFRRVEAGAVDNVRLKALSGGRDLFRVILTSREIPRHLVSFSDRLGREVIGAVKDILVSMHRDPEGIKILGVFSNTARFEELKEEDLRVINSFRNLVK
jgi:phosphonate transport system substrate-binding protein